MPALSRRTLCFATAALFGTSRFTPLSAKTAKPIRIACIGEQTTHSLHRTNDPEFPLLLGEALDADFKADDIPNPTEGGFFSGGGTRYCIGNFGKPNASVIDHDLENPKSLLRSEQVTQAETFAPDILILGPFGEHELLTKVSMDHFAPDLGQLANRFSAFKSHPRVYLLLPIPRTGVDDNETYRRIRDDTQKVAHDQNLPVIDLWTPFLGHAELFKDPTHLTEDGRRKLAQIVADVIRTDTQRH